MGFSGFERGVLLVFFAYYRTRRRDRQSNGTVRVGVGLLRASQRWLEVSMQDQNALVRWEHLVMARTCLDEARRVLPDALLQREASADVHALSMRIDDSTERATSTFMSRCPKLRREMRAVALEASAVALPIREDALSK